MEIDLKKTKNRGHPDLNRGPLDLQSNALPLSYTPTQISMLPNKLGYYREVRLGGGREDRDIHNE